MSTGKPYILDRGIHRPAFSIRHREEEYSSDGFDGLLAMQERHFWYRGRHRFLWEAVKRTLARERLSAGGLRVVDLGGGCGGWVKYLSDRGFESRELAVADSSERALRFAEAVVPARTLRIQIDLLNLAWHQRWEVAFLLDVLEHIPEDQRALREIHQTLAPGGLLFVTTPALKCFWSWNDEAVHHVRRYSKADFRRLAGACGFELLDARYFMFLLSPLLVGSRFWTGRRVARMNPEERRALGRRMHRVPSRAINGALSAVFAAETPLGHCIPFPWGTSVLGVFRKPSS